MRQREIEWTEAVPGLDVILQFKEPPGCGQGGTVEWCNGVAIRIRSGTAGIVHTYWKAEIAEVCVEEYLDADECLNYDPDTCKGPVDYWHSGGLNGRSWPRCHKHGLQRLEDHENSMAKYADSDVEPDWFDPANAGERWSDDY